MFNKRILLIGDSITEEFDTEKLLPEFNIINKGISGNNSNDLLNRLNRDLLPHNPDIIFILIGTNDLAQGFSDNQILKNLNRIIKKIIYQLHDTQIYVTSILPTRNNDLRPNERIKELNKKIEQATLELNVNFFDLYPLFADEKDNLKKEFTEDGLHLNESAYQLWAKYLSEFLGKIL